MRGSKRFVEAAGVVGLGLLVVLAGCSGFFGANGGDTPEPTDTGPDLSDTTLPPGVNETRLVDYEALLSAHRSAMAAEGFVYTFEHHRVDEFPNNTTTTEVDASGEVRAAPGLTAFREEVDRDVPNDETTSVWTNGTAGYERVVGNGTEYERYPQNASELDTTHYMLRTILGQDRWNVSAVSDDGSRIVLVSTVRPGGPPLGLGRVEVEGRLVVGSEGRIHELNATTWKKSYDSGVDGRINYTRTFSYEVTEFGNVSVSSPGWVDDARNATE